MESWLQIFYSISVIILIIIVQYGINVFYHHEDAKGEIQGKNVV